MVDPPVVLAPLAGITNVAFRRLCREYGAGLYISEMITSRALVEGNPKTMQMVSFAAGRDAPLDPALRGRPGGGRAGGPADRRARIWPITST